MRTYNIIKEVNVTKEKNIYYELEPVNGRDFPMKINTHDIWTFFNCDDNCDNNCYKRILLNEFVEKPYSDNNFVDVSDKDYENLKDICRSYDRFKPGNIKPFIIFERIVDED